MHPSKRADGTTDHPRTRDPVLTELGDVATRYRQLSDSHEQQAEEIHHLRARVLELSAQVEGQRLAIGHAQASARRTSGVTRDLHESLFTGGTEALLLRSCLALTDATRGAFFSVRGQSVRTRAALGVPARPGESPSSFLQALVRRVAELEDTVVWGDGDTVDLPGPDEDADRFRTCAAVPVSLHGRFSGVLVVADKRTGNFNEPDLEALLAVGEHAAVSLQNARLEHELQQTYLQLIGMLADVVEAKDSYTHGHSHRVSELARMTAVRLGLDQEAQRLVCFAALLHDIGKIALSDGLLHKPGALLPEERELVRAHAAIGHRLLTSVPALTTVAEIVLHHHEWFDGNGYPHGIAGERIPIGSRIVAVVDAYGAMLDERSYKAAMEEPLARAELRRCAGTQFDPAVVHAFLAVLDEPVPETPADGCGLLPFQAPGVSEAGRGGDDSGG